MNNSNTGGQKFIIIKCKVQSVCPCITAGMYIKGAFKHMISCNNGHARPAVIEFYDDSVKLCDKNKVNG